jgi:hypothetical protein
MSTARKQKHGGTGITTTVIGAEVSFDDLGKFVKSTHGVQYADLFRDQASNFVQVYGLKEKSDMAEALRKYCKFVAACGKGPVRLARCDATAVVTKVDGSVTQEFLAACVELNLRIQPSAPEDQQKTKQSEDSSP